MFKVHCNNMVKGFFVEHLARELNLSLHWCFDCSKAMILLLLGLVLV